MGDDILAGKFKQLRGRLKERWGDLTDDELMQSEGNADRLAGLLQEKYGYSKERAKQELSEFLTDVDRSL
jgi:uncharacterized protein YjbJ (UPF0337 family)